MDARSKVISIELASSLIEGIFLFAWLFNFWSVSLQVLLVASFIINSVAMPIAWVQFVDGKKDDL